MIVVDSSPIIAILNAEPDSAVLEQCLRLSGRCLMAAPTKLELTMVAVSQKDIMGELVVNVLIQQYDIEIIDWTNAMANFAVEAFLKFGKGRHPASLNFGDCITYALAKSLDAPLLYKGNDFAKTDIRSAL